MFKVDESWKSNDSENLRSFDGALYLDLTLLTPFSCSKICGQLDHASIVHLENVYWTDTSMLLVLEYLPGGDLFDGIVSRKQYSEKDACACARQVLLALAYLRRNGILHRVIIITSIINYYFYHYIYYYRCVNSSYFIFVVTCVQDLKPENLLLSEKPNNERPPVLKLTDFGIAKKLEGTS